MKTLIIILVLLSSSVYSEDLKGLFGIQLGKIFNDELKADDFNTENKIYDLESIKNINDINKLDKILEEIKWSNGYNIKITPKIFNDSFDTYSVTLSPATKKIIHINGSGKGMPNKKRCEDIYNFYTKFFREKYKDDYFSIGSRKGIDDSSFNIIFIKNKPPKQETVNKKVIDLSKNLLTNTFQEAPTKKLDPSDRLIAINCNKKNLNISILNFGIFKKILLEEKELMENAILIQREKLTNSDTSGL